MRIPLIAGNWKMHKTAVEAVELVEELKPLVTDLSADRDVVVCPTATSLSAVRAALATPDLVARAHAAGKQVHAWTDYDRRLATALVDRGVDNLISDIA